MKPQDLTGMMSQMQAMTAMAKKQMDIQTKWIDFGDTMLRLCDIDFPKKKSETETTIFLKSGSNVDVNLTFTEVKKRLGV